MIKYSGIGWPCQWHNCVWLKLKSNWQHLLIFETKIYMDFKLLHYGLSWEYGVFCNHPFDITSWIKIVSNTFRWNNRLFNPLVRAWEGQFLLGWKVRFLYESVLFTAFSTKTVRLHITLIRLHNGVYHDIINLFLIKTIKYSNWESQFDT